MASVPDVIGGEGSFATAAQGGADGDTAAAANQHRANEDDHDYNGEYDEEEGEEEEEEIVMDEEEMLQMLDQVRWYCVVSKFDEAAALSCTQTLRTAG